jgi:hypothetical protein
MLEDEASRCAALPADEGQKPSHKTPQPSPQLSEVADVHAGSEGEKVEQAVSEASDEDTKEGSPNSTTKPNPAPETSPVVRELPRPPEHVYDEDIDDEFDGQRDASIIPRLPGVVGTPWAWRLPKVKAGQYTQEDKAERTRQMIMRMLDRNERQQMLFLWRLNATRNKASALAVWAVDQGNRKAYEVERSLMAENNWATRSVIWEGYRHSPLVGVTDSCWFWTTKMQEGGGMTMERMREELKMARQRTAFLAAQLESARQQLVDWQEVADFQSMDGTWQSMRLREVSLVFY